ncbi:MAG: M48 family metallopeptidase [Pseudoalteromonas sp.]|uniref:M48 family metallopeptidase n=2 Tax=Pseudoalteromonas TaxID=53246 RepID=UPI003F98C8D8
MRRKTVAIKVHQEQLTVYAPHFVKEADIKKWLNSQAQWITKQLNKQQSQVDTRQYPLKTHQVKLFSEPLTVIFEQGKLTQWHFSSEFQMVTLTISGRVKKHHNAYQNLLEAFLHKQLESYVEMRVGHYCQLMDESLPEQITIRQYKRRWGSCNSRRELTFNIMLAAAPQWVIDYVIVHELAHLRFLNHSSHFWQYVNNYYPDYNKATKWLKQHGMSLQWVFE